jgi:AmmeMemoRadiSam system protein B
MDYPKLRQVEAFPLETSGKKTIGLRDPSTMDDKVIVVSQPTFFLITLFDGKHSLLDIKAEYMRKYGEMLFTENLEEIVKQLDDNYLLENERYEAYRQRMEDEFRKADLRPATFAGKSYASDSQKLPQQLEAFFTSPQGPGKPVDSQKDTPIRGIIAPHIDFQRGGPCYAWAYKELAESLSPDLFIILGTVHVPTHNPFVLTRKDFETPLGRVETEKTIIESLEKKVHFDFFQDEIVQKAEHSIEFQVVFLNYLCRDRKPFKIVPILCSSFHDVITQDTSPQQKPHLADFINALSETVAETDCQTCFIASADLAHVGMRFGDPSPPSPTSLQFIADEDRKMLSYVEQMDADGFYQFIQREKDGRKICGLPPIYTLLRVMEASEGKLLNYQQSVEPHGSSVVTFASMVFS